MESQHKPKTTNRDRSYYRHHRYRVIAHRQKICKTSGWVYRHRGSLSKGKIHCSCRSCKYEKYYDVLKKQYKSKLAMTCRDLNEYRLS